MYNHVHHYHYGVDQNVNSSQAQNCVFADATRVSRFGTSYQAPRLLASPPLEQQKDSLWYPHQQINHVLSSTFGHNEILASPQELVLFSLLQDHQQQQHDHQQMMRYHDNPLNQYDEQESSLNEWTLVHANLKGGVLPLSPISVQSADVFDSSPILMGSHPMCSQTYRPNPANHQYQLNNHPALFASQISNKSNQHYQTKEPTQESAEQQQPKHRKKTIRKRASRSQLQCTICLKTFSRPYNLKSHQRTHTKERPFLCIHPDCGWTFARPHDLKRHELLHSGVKPFECVCGKRFSRSDAFKRHQSRDIACAISAAQQRKKKRRSDAH